MVIASLESHQIHSIFVDSHFSTLRQRIKTMPFSHHSHSGQFCAHAKGSLEETVRQAIQCKMKVFALTEHIGRDMVDLYPEEVSNTLYSGELN
jgi:PHP domain-containing protein